MVDKINTHGIINGEDLLVASFKKEKFELFKIGETIIYTFKNKIIKKMLYETNSKSERNGIKNICNSNNR